MSFRVYLLPSAEEDLFEIYKYVYTNDSEESAEKLYNSLYEKCSSLQDYPHRGYVPPELKLISIEDFLEIHYKPYRIIYQIIKDKVFVHYILDGRRDIQKLLHERFFKEQ